MASQPYQKETIDYAWLLFQHLKLISEHVAGTNELLKGNLADRLLTYKKMAHHMETLIYPHLIDKIYWEKRNTILEKLPPLNMAAKSPENSEEYSDAITEWLQMLMVYAHNNQLLRQKVRWDFSEFEKETVEE